MLWATPDEVTLLAVDHAGNDVWRRGLGRFKGMHGIGTSPIVVGELVVLANDQQGKASLIAVDRRSGKIRWQIDRKSGLTPASTPCLHDDGRRGPRLIFTSTAHGITAVDPAKGIIDWQLEKVHHLLSHSDSADWLKVNQFFLEQVAYVARKMDSIQEGDRTLLDNSMLMLCSSMLHGGHDANQLPVVMLGGGGGRIKGSQNLNYLGKPDRQMTHGKKHGEDNTIPLHLLRLPKEDEYSQ